ncbi:MAG: HAD hydrolase family protein, partial [Olsenella umbonata]|nr:HAD hydrolase family protein [Parafannyhessea umbonata]
MIRLFASDLDGTLLNALHRTDPVVLRSIARVRQAGLRFS